MGKLSVSSKKFFSVQDKNLKSRQGKSLIGVRRKPDKPSWIRLTKFEPNCDPT
jgi:hypothetical protein